MSTMSHPPSTPTLIKDRPSKMTTLHSWIITVDHKKLGLMYCMTALLFFVIAGFEAMMIRWQLFIPDNDIIVTQVYNEFMTMHGTTMVFFVGMPMLTGFATYLIPLMVGARDMAFPRLNALGFWLTFFSGILLYSSFFMAPALYASGAAPDFGWFAYAPLTAKTFDRGHTVDYWIFAITLSGFGTMIAGTNIITTTLCMRCKGMKLSKMPLFVWIMLTDAVLMVVGIPPLTAAQAMLLMDRELGAHFFDVNAGGSAIFWQHLFWFFGHPEVYILILPAFAIASEVIPVFSRKVIFGYPLMVAATVGIAFIALGVWVHHMFAVGLSPAINAIFSGTTFLISIPTGIKIFTWMATMYGGRLKFDTPMLFLTAFLGLFTVGGLTGITLASVPADWQLHDTYYVVGHFHYVLFGGLIFAVFGGMYYWYPKVTGRLMSEKLGKWNFWIFFISFNLTFFPMHIAGLLGMPRRIYTYEAGHGWELWNMLSSVGAFMQMIAVALFVWNAIASLKRGKVAGPDPWDAWTLEWATTSPPPEYNFEEIPTVRSRRPLWDLKHPEDPDWKYE